MTKSVPPARCLFTVLVALGLGGVNGALAQDSADTLSPPPVSNGATGERELERQGTLADDDDAVAIDDAVAAGNSAATRAAEDAAREEPAQGPSSPEGSVAAVSLEPVSVEPDERTAPVSVELMFGTNAPLDVSLGARLVLFERLLLGASVGRSAYGNLAGNIAGAIGGDDIALIVEPVFSNAWLFRLNVGVRPFGLQGPELTVGYARMNSVATWDAATFSLPSSVGSLSADIGLNLLTVELGWSINVYGPLFLRPAIGWAQVRGADVSLASSANASGQVATALESAERFAEETLVDYGQTPTLSLTLGARF